MLFEFVMRRNTSRTYLFLPLLVLWFEHLLEIAKSLLLLDRSSTRLLVHRKVLLTVAMGLALDSELSRLWWSPNSVPGSFVSVTPYFLLKFFDLHIALDDVLAILHLYLVDRVLLALDHAPLLTQVVLEDAVSLPLGLKFPLKFLHGPN